MTVRDEHYVPAAGYDWLLPLYDPLLRFGMREARFKGRLIDLADVRSGHDVLDLGCGTGTLLAMLARRAPGARLRGVDGDPQALAIAERKLRKAGVDAPLDEALAQALPYATASFDRVLSSLVLHHLTDEGKRAAVAEARRVLRPGGELHVVDFTAQAHGLHAFLARLVGGREDRAAETGLVSLLREAGFASAAEVGRHYSVFGTLSFVSARGATDPVAPPATA